MNEENHVTGDEKILHNLSLNHVGCIPVIWPERKETLEETLSHYKLDDSWPRREAIPRTTYLYGVSESDLEPIRDLMEKGGFPSPKIIRKYSCLGFPYQIYVEDYEGYELYFDGMLYLACKAIKKGAIALNEIPELTNAFSNYNYQIPGYLSGSVKNLWKTKSRFPPYDMVQSFYTTDIHDWKLLGLWNREGAQLCVMVNDENYRTLTGLVHLEAGKLFPLYIGDTEIIREMKSHNVFFISEYKNFLEHVGSLRKEVSITSKMISETMDSIAEPLWYFHKKYKLWNAVKKSMINMRSIMRGLYRYDLFIETLEDILEKGWSLYNSPRQIQIPGDTLNSKQQNWIQNFSLCRLEQGKIVDLKDHPADLDYKDTAMKLKQKIEFLKSETSTAHRDSINLQSMVQTEFSLYAVLIAIIAILLSVVTGMIAFITLFR